MNNDQLQITYHQGGVVAHAEGDALHRALLEAAHAAADDGAL